jgi:hypothetical protein
MMGKAALGIVALVEAMFSLLVHALTKFLIGGGRPRYNPARHYMRGPGPKWAEKHGMAAAPVRADTRRDR